ncbi:MAG: sugar phosphate isomerase/epimerase family protein [Opitutales bacterium]
MFTFGIQQGRILPDIPGTYQNFPALWEHEPTLASDYGFGSIELVDDHNGHCLHSIQSGALIKFDACPASSLCAASMTTLEGEAVRAERFKKIAAATHNSEIETVVVPFLESNACESTQHLIDCLGHIAEVMDTEGATFALCIESDLAQDACVDAIRQLESNTQFSICLDTGNEAASGRDPAKFLSEYSNYIGHVHLKDRRLNGPNVQPGTGSVDFLEVFSALKSVNYSGRLILETAHGSDPKASAQRNIKFFQSRAAQA